MAKYIFEVWDNGKRELRYTILRNDGMAWICGKNKAERSDETDPVFIGPIGPRENHLGRQIAYEQWPLTIRNWIDSRNAVHCKKVI